MNKKLLTVIALAMVFASCQTGYTRYVNPMVGTDGHGHTFPGAIVPFGQIQPSPDTRLSGWDGCSGYHYSDDTIYGFSHTHLSGTGCEDYGDVLLMPVTAEEGGDWRYTQELPQELFRSHFSHHSEKAQPGYYRVVVDRNRVMVELTASRRVACHRYTFPHRGKKGFVVDLRHRDKVIGAGFHPLDGKGVLTGWRESNAWNPDQKCFFALQCNQAIQEVRMYDGGLKALVVLPDECTEAEVYVAISGVDCDGAVRNLATRQHDDFDKMHKEAHRCWEQALGKIEVAGGSRKERRNFYTALYHCYTSPFLWSDADGRYRGMDDSIHLSKRDIYTVFSLWDTYRTLHPLMTLIEPQTTADFVNTMLCQYEQGGELTMWELAANETHCMIGYHSAPVILDAYRAGLLKDWTPQRRVALLRAMVATSNRSEAHRDYAQRGYMDSQVDNESVSKTLEYAFDDWCIAEYARLLIDDHLVADSSAIDSTGQTIGSIRNAYLRRCQSWQNVMDPNGFMHARRNGAFVTPFDPTEVNNHYTEANSWQYSSYVPHDIDGWIVRLGGKGKAEAFLDSLFNASSRTTGRDQSDITGMIGQYAHGNEPSHHAAYLYACLGNPEKCDKTVHKILSELYSPTPEGLCGNEDCGQMSAWYVMSAMGLYPLCPGSGEYVTVKPLFSRITIHREEGDIVINPSSWPSGKFWRDGKLFESSRCQLPDSVRITPAPYFNDWQQRFKDSTIVTLSAPPCFDGSCTAIYYTMDGSIPDTNAMCYRSPFWVSNDAVIKAVAYSPRYGYSTVVRHDMTRFIADKRLKYITRPDPQYIENGEEGLIDRLYGTTNYRIGGWQGWRQDMEVMIDLKDARPLYSVGIDCLENMRSWIFFPTHIEISVSNDAATYIPWTSRNDLQQEFPATRQREEETVQHTFTCSGTATMARYIKIKVHNFGKMPAWHASAGEQAWLFVDEIEINGTSAHPMNPTVSNTIKTTAQ